MEKEFNLTIEELAELQGGVMQKTKAMEENTNHNSSSGCLCWYNNHSGVTNTNDVGGCLCSCV